VADDGSGEGTDAERCAAAAVRDIERGGTLGRAETLGASDPERVQAYFDVGDAELDAVDGTLADVVRERVALLDVEK
jgi:KEOPS complex subunit Cgi121